MNSDKALMRKMQLKMKKMKRQEYEGKIKKHERKKNVTMWKKREEKKHKKDMNLRRVMD